MSKFKKFLIANLALEGVWHIIGSLIGIIGLMGYSYSWGKPILWLVVLSDLYFGIVCMIASKYLGKHHHNH